MTYFYPSKQSGEDVIAHAAEKEEPTLFSYPSKLFNPGKNKVSKQTSIFLLPLTGIHLYAWGNLHKCNDTSLTTINAKADRRGPHIYHLQGAAFGFGLFQSSRRKWMFMCISSSEFVNLSWSSWPLVEVFQI